MISPNIIFIVLDSLREDKVFTNYKNKNLTPFINSISKNSIYCENCTANYTWTLTSHISMFTGLYLSQIISLNKITNNKALNKIPTLTEILKDIGYFTIGFTENPYISDITGLSKGFDIFLKGDKGGMNWRSKTFKLNFLRVIINYLILFVEERTRSKKLLNFLKKIKKQSEGFIEKIIKKLFWKNIFLSFENNTINDLDQFNQILYDNPKKPFYAFFNIMATHIPYIPSKKVLKHFEITIKDFKIIKDFLLNTQDYLTDLNYKNKHLSDKQIKVVEKFYNASVFYSDIIVKDIFSILKKYNLIENSYIIITSDHGEHLCNYLDHYLWGHGVFHSVYESLIKVPLMIYNANFKERRVKNQVALKDLYHTILHLTNQKNKFLIIKNSIIYQIENNCTPHYIYGEYLLETKMNFFSLYKSFQKYLIRELYQKIFSNIYYLKSDRYKYIKFNNKIEEFYDLLKDSSERIKIFNKNHNRYNDMKPILIKMIENMKDLDKLKIILTEKEKSVLNKRIRHTDFTYI